MSDLPQLERPFFPDIEGLFSEYVEYYGGSVIEKLETNKTDRHNADYLFETPQIIAELKTFEKDVFSEPEDIPRLMELYQKWLEKGLMTGEDFREYTFGRKPLPQKCTEDLIERASKKIERALHKADKQIEETKKNFGKESASGIIFLINDGNYFFTNQGFLMVISQLIGRKFKISSFDVVVYLTINQVTRKQDSDLDYGIWIPIYTKIDEHGETIVSDELHDFVNKFGEKFINDFLTLKTGHQPKDFTQIDNIEETMEEFNKHKFIPKDVIYKQ